MTKVEHCELCEHSGGEPWRDAACRVVLVEARSVATNIAAALVARLG